MACIPSDILLIFGRCTLGKRGSPFQKKKGKKRKPFSKQKRPKKSYK
ncbi:hypothetical protein FM107_20670 [Sphingobacterium sp. JB170]|nr:hypothetical protein FM107_20670 [Sphingobacterium sp. JB170]